MTKTLSALAALALLATATPSLAAGIEGTWDRSDGKSKIKISKCGSSFCSKIIWLDKARKDTKNENAALRGRNLVGTTISKSLKPAGANKWSGSIYSPRKGKTYNGFATLSGNNLKMKGCLTSAGILCQTAKFKRAN